MDFIGLSLYWLAAGALAFAALIVFLTSFVSIHENQVGVVAKRFSRTGSLPEGRVVALNGEAGFQAATLPPGIHFGYWPWQYKVVKYPLTAIEQGHIGLVIANDGAPAPVDRVLSNVVDCDFFQDGAKFLKNGGQKGPPDFDPHRRLLSHQSGAFQDYSERQDHRDRIRQDRDRDRARRRAHAGWPNGGSGRGGA